MSKRQKRQGSKSKRHQGSRDGAPSAKRRGASDTGPSPRQAPGRPRAGAAPQGPRSFQARDARGAGERAEQPTPWLAEARATTKKRVDEWLQESSAMRRVKSDTAKTDPHALDPWQEQVLEALVSGESVVVDAPTTAGKTRAVEAFFRANLQNPLFRAVYTTPVKSLSNDKLREFREMFGSENVGIATGDVKENLQAPIVVATLESYRNSLLGVEPDLGRTLAVFDEYHYLQDEGRGSAWEEALILTPRSCQVLLLSASVANAEDFVSWLKSLGDGRQCVLVRTERRPVPLVHLVWHNGAWLHVDTLPGSVFRHLDDKRLQLPLRHEDLAPRLQGLVAMELTPCIVYVGRRLACETLAVMLCRGLTPLPEEANRLIGESLQASHAECGALQFINQKLRHMLQVYGVGFHHSGLAAPARIAIETLVKNGLLRFCTATMGLSLGINFSVRSALIADYQRPGELGFTDYSPSEVLQMLGRAGRRGRDAVGFSLWPTVEAYAKMGDAKRDAVSSRLRNDPTTFLGLVGRGYGLRAIETFYSKSFRRFKDRHIDLSLITKSRLQKKLDASDLPCASPAAEFARFTRKSRKGRDQGARELLDFAKRDDEAPPACNVCPYRARCHTILEAKSQGSLTALHLHLHRIGALERDESLSSYGKIARYFPQAGGLVFSKLIDEGRFDPDRISAAAELAASMAMARFKEPGSDSRYRLPFEPEAIEALLEEFYPLELFPELYDAPYGKRDYYVIREFNPGAGYIVKEWLHGMPWQDLIQTVCTEQFGTGDVMSLMYRVGTYLQSIKQAGITELQDSARAARDSLLREPMAFALTA